MENRFYIEYSTGGIELKLQITDICHEEELAVLLKIFESIKETINEPQTDCAWK